MRALGHLDNGDIQPILAIQLKIVMEAMCNFSFQFPDPTILLSKF